MELKTIIAIVLVAFIVGGFIFLQIKNKKKKQKLNSRAGSKMSALILSKGGCY